MGSGVTRHTLEVQGNPILPRDRLLRQQTSYPAARCHYQAKQCRALESGPFLEGPALHNKLGTASENEKATL